MSGNSDARLEALLNDALGKEPLLEPNRDEYLPVDSFSQSSECDERGCPSRGGRTWFLIGLALVAVVAIALAWREVKRHCASGEERLWGCIKVPLAIRTTLTPGSTETERDADPYFTPL